MKVDIDKLKSKDEYMYVAVYCLEHDLPFVSFNKKHGYIITYFLPEYKAIVNTSTISSGVFINLSQNDFLNHVKLALVCEGIRMVTTKDNLIKPYSKLIEYKRDIVKTE